MCAYQNLLLHALKFQSKVFPGINVAWEKTNGYEESCEDD